MWKGIIVNKSLVNESLINKYKLFNQKVSGDWIIYGIEIPNSQIDIAVAEIQNGMKEPEAFYNHFYNGEEIIVVFKKNIFKVSHNKNTWNGLLAYGETLGIPKAQLDFYPNKFSQEKEYFNN